MIEVAARHAPHCNQTGHSRHCQMKMVLLGSDSIPSWTQMPFIFDASIEVRYCDRGSSKPQLRESRRFLDDSRPSRRGLGYGPGPLCSPYGDACVAFRRWMDWAAFIILSGWPSRFGRHHHRALWALVGIGRSGSCFSKKPALSIFEKADLAR